MGFKIFIIDDEAEICLSLCEILNSKGYQCTYQQDPLKVLPEVEKTNFNLLIIDIRMPGLGGIDLLRILNNKYRNIPVIIISGYATVDNAVQAMKYGAVNVFKKPLEISRLLNEIEQIRVSTEKKSENTTETDYSTNNAEMRKVISQVEKAAPTEATVLITGESGTGKELIANTIHSKSRRRNHPFITLNCAAIPETLLESEMFGHERGAFTDAKEQKKGLFEMASVGSIFLDEIGDMSSKTQAKMLRVLQEKKFTRVGGTQLIKTDCRVIAATNKNLEDLIKTGNFREDLYYRLSVINLHLPPLRQRREDIPNLLNLFLNNFCQIYGKKINGFSLEVENLLKNHSWPGNIRELKNFVERAVILSSADYIGLDDLPDHYRIISEESFNTNINEEYENSAREILLKALRLSNGKKQEAARLLRIDRKTLYNRMKKLNIE